MKLDFTRAEADELMRVLKAENDAVRLVEPGAQKVLAEAGREVTDPVCCHLWGRCERCENCTSLRALHTQSRAFKIEYAQHRIYWVTSRFLRLDGASCVLELVNDVTKSLILDSDRRGEVSDLIRNYNHLLITDPLTGLYNRRFLDESFLPSLACCADRTIPVNLAVLDLDSFKQVNDTYGHQAGDELLKDAAGYWKRRYHARESGRERLVVRYGGDELLIITCGEPAAQFRAGLTRSYSQMRRVCYFSQEVQIPFGITFGTACSTELPQPWNWEALFALADRRMYEAKQRRPAPAAPPQAAPAAPEETSASPAAPAASADTAGSAPAAAAQPGPGLSQDAAVQNTALQDTAAGPAPQTAPQSGR